MIEITRSAFFEATPARAWALVRDFNAMPNWNASVRASHIEDGPADRVGCRRVLVFDDGGVWTHLLSGLSDEDMRLQYRIVGTPQPMRVPVWNYRAEMQVRADARRPLEACTVHWWASFETAQPQDMCERAGQVFDAGLAGLRACLGRGAQA